MAQRITMGLLAFFILGSFRSLLPAAGSERQDGVLLFAAGQGTTSAAQLLNVGSVRAADKERVTVLEIIRDTDPYAKVEWLFRLVDPCPADERRRATEGRQDTAGALPGDVPGHAGVHEALFMGHWPQLVLEVEYFDGGAGVIQPVLLRDDAFAGEWLEPQRAVSFTRLNTQRVRRALFEFKMPRLGWQNTANPHLKVAGLQWLKSLWAYPEIPESQWQAAAESVPSEVLPMVRLQRPMEITCTVGIPDVGNPPSLEIALANIREYAPLAKLLGFTSIECFVRWDLIEPHFGKFDFSHYDPIVAAVRHRGLKWYPNLVITSAFALPAWYAETTGFRCLEHGQANQVPSIWNSANRSHVTRVLKAFGDHYEPTGILEAVRLGPSGNFGEAQYPAGAGGALGYWGARMHAHIGWWAGDGYAKKDFQQFARTRYGTVKALNEAWGEGYADFDQIAPQLPETYRTRRGRLDMTGWYTESMTRWCDFWAEAARAALPNTPIYQSAGGWGYREAGTDFTALSESMRDHAGGIRLTNETDSFAQNYYATRLAATAARLYDIPLGYEPAGYHSARGTVARFFSTAATNGNNLFTRHSVLFTDPYSVDNWLRDYTLLDARAAPVVDVAIYYPETMNQLDDGAFRHLYAWGFNPRAAAVRRCIDADFLDERLIRQGFLDRYRVLIFCWGNTIEADVQQRVDRWLRAGGTAIYPTHPRGPQETVEGDTSVFRAWERGDTGKGAFHRFQGDMEPVSLYGDFVEGILQQVPGLHPGTQLALAVRHPEHVFISVLENGLMLVLNYAEGPATIELPGRFTERLPPLSTWVVRLDQAEE